jgi:formylglycine-generating enzyme required for sulfatase activity
MPKITVTGVICLPTAEGKPLKEPAAILPWVTGKVANVCDVNCTYETTNANVDDGYPYTSPVGNFSDGRSPYGAYDMAGNVWEWVIDWYDKAYYSTLPENTHNPTGPESGEGHVLRGGSWISNIFNARTTLRLTYKPDFQAAQIGFRCVSVP